MLDLFTLLVFLLVIAAIYTARSMSRRQRREEAVAARLVQLQRQIERERGRTSAVLDTSDSIALVAETTLLPALPWLGRRLERLRDGITALGWRKTLRKRLLISIAAATLTALALARMTATTLALAWLSAPLLWLVLCGWAYQMAMTKYLAALARALPEAIDAITRICRAGVPLHGAFSIAADHLQGPLSGELREVDNWLKLGVPLKQAMQNSAARVPLAEYRFFAVILIISQESGGRLGDTLERLAATLRARAELGMKVQAKTSEARASAKIVAALVPCMMLYMYFNAPGDFRFLLNDPTGNKVLIYVLGSVTLGLSIIQMMVRKVR